MTDPSSRILGSGNDLATISWSVKFVDHMHGTSDSASQVGILDTRSKDLIDQIHCFIPGNDCSNVHAYVTKGGGRAWHMFYGIGAVDEALHIKSAVPMGAEFASEIGA